MVGVRRESESLLDTGKKRATYVNGASAIMTHNIFDNLVFDDYRDNFATKKTQDCLPLRQCCQFRES